MGPAERAARERAVWQLLGELPDPEIPVLTLGDLGIVRTVCHDAAGRLHVAITPTYSGCPATEVIRHTVRAALDRHGWTDAELEQVLAPPWSHEWLSAAGRRKLLAYGIAPPAAAHAAVACPRCGSRDTRCVSDFGSTPCKAHYQCAACREPFDHFKCL
ncbi:MAG: phenylacetate-CoA oxygenase subunit PaaJ [Gammaproteobacteria bacterium]|nr:phenylacetate-CoA oxygenase subunit PaaJ [Gammaproteobacteria bacterium]